MGETLRTADDVLRFFFGDKSSEMGHEWLKALSLVDPIRGWLTGLEASVLWCGSRSANHEVVEIGSYRGRSTTALAHAASVAGNRPVNAVDRFTDSPTALDEFLTNIERNGLRALVNVLDGDSCEVWERWSDPIGFLFIDGGHDSATVRSDLMNWTRFVVPGGYVFLHDYHHTWPDVISEVNLFLELYEDEWETAALVSDPTTAILLRRKGGASE